MDLSQLHRNAGISWQVDEERDLAASLMPFSQEFDAKAVGLDSCLTIEGVLPSMQCFTIGCPYGVLGFDATRATPLVQGGVVAGVDAGTKRLFITAPTFPGNSGGPLIVVRPPYDPDGHAVLGRKTVFLAGVVSQYAVIRPMAEDLPEGTPALHLGVVSAVDAVLALLDSPGARALVETATRSSA